MRKRTPIAEDTSRTPFACAKCGKPHVTRHGGRACAGHKSRARDADGKPVPCQLPPQNGEKVCGSHGIGPRARRRNGTRKDPRTTSLTHGGYARPETLALLRDKDLMAAIEHYQEAGAEETYDAIRARALGLADRLTGLSVGKSGAIELDAKEASAMASLLRTAVSAQDGKVKLQRSYTREQVLEIREIDAAAIAEVYRDALAAARAGEPLQDVDPFMLRVAERAREISAARARGG